MKRIECDFPIIGKCEMNIPSGKAGEFIIRQLRNYIIKNIETSNEKIKNIEIFNKDIVREFTVLCKFHELMLARNFRIENGYILANGYKVIVKDDRVIVCKVEETGYIKKVKNICRKIKGIIPRYKYNYCSGIYTQYYLNALFFLYAAYKNFICVHGSCVTYKGKIILITGLDGVGKSSMGLLFSDIEGEILADNMVLYKRGKAINLNLAMRVDPQCKTKYEELYYDSDFKEVLPNVCDKGIVDIDYIFCLVKNNGKNIDKSEFMGTETEWTMYMNGAQEVCNANKVMMPWIFLNSMRNTEKSDRKIKITILSIPSGKLLDAREEIIKCL